jgi:hypothetical protein
MTANRNLKLIIRTRMAKTGESYSAARAQILHERDARDADGSLVAVPDDPVDVAIIKVNKASARVRRLDVGAEAVTFRCSGAHDLVPGQIATVRFTKRWSHAGHAYASGKVLATRTDIAGLGLESLPLENRGEMDARRDYEPHTPQDPCYDLWRKNTAKPRTAFEFDQIAWDAIAAISDDFDDTPVCDAAELHRAGYDEEARELLMGVLAADLRCIDAHAHLGNLAFDDSPEAAMVHYEIGVGIGELSLGPSFSGYLPWGMINNRPFLRSLKGRALCLWRLGRYEEATKDFERILSLNPNDNQGVRFCLPAVRRGVEWTPDDEWLGQESGAAVEGPMLN